METKSSNINSAGFSLPSVLVGVALLGISAVIVSNTVVDARRSQRTADLKLSTNKLQQAALDAVTRRVKDFVIGDCKGDRWSSNSSVTDVEKAFSELPLIQDSGAASRLVFTKVKGEIPSSFDCAQPESPATLGTGDSFRFCMEIESPGASQAVERRLLELLIVPVNLASDQAIKCLDAAGAGAGVKVAWQLHTQIDNKKVNQSNSKSFLKDSGVFLVSMETESYSGTCNITASRVGSTNQCTVNVSGLGRRPPTLLKNGAVDTGITWARAPSANNDAFTTPALCETDQTTSFTAQSADGGSFCSAVVQPACSAADRITFEGPGLARNTPISNQFQSSHGVVFSLSDGSLPILGQVNTPDPFGWLTSTLDSLTNVVVDDGTSPSIVGQLFLMPLDKSKDLIITYSNPVSEASGYIIDIDGREKFTITPINAAGVRLTGSAWSYEAGNQDLTYDGRAMKWTVARPSNDIQKIEINGRHPDRDLGFALDQFSPSKICP